MQTHHNKYLLFNRGFILGLVLLAVNDHYLKPQFPNWLTGKISDFAGLFILPMFLLFLFPKLNKAASLVSGLLFVFWKLPVSQSFIELYNQFAIIPVVRTIDYTDLVALTVLPFAHLLIQKIEQFKIKQRKKSLLNPLYILIPASIIFMATSPPIGYYMKPNGDIHIGKSYRIKMNKESILKRLKTEGFMVRSDTSQQEISGRVDNYVIEDIILSNGRDTIKSIQFGLIGNGDKTLFLLNNVNLYGNKKISDWKQLKQYSKYYNKVINSGIIKEIK